MPTAPWTSRRKHTGPGHPEPPPSSTLPPLKGLSLRTPRTARVDKCARPQEGRSAVQRDRGQQKAGDPVASSPAGPFRGPTVGLPPSLLARLERTALVWGRGGREGPLGVGGKAGTRCPEGASQGRLGLLHQADLARLGPGPGNAVVDPGRGAQHTSAHPGSRHDHRGPHPPPTAPTWTQVQLLE